MQIEWDKTWTKIIKLNFIRSSSVKIWDSVRGRQGNARRAKNVFIVKKKQFQVEKNPYMSNRLIRKVNLHFIGINRDPWLSITYQTNTKRLAKNNKLIMEIFIYFHFFQQQLGYPLVWYCEKETKKLRNGQISKNHNIRMKNAQYQKQETVSWKKAIKKFWSWFTSEKTRNLQWPSYKNDRIKTKLTKLKSPNIF